MRRVFCILFVLVAAASLPAADATPRQDLPSTVSLVVRALGEYQSLNDLMHALAEEDEAIVSDPAEALRHARAAEALAVAAATPRFAIMTGHYATLNGDLLKALRRTQVVLSQDTISETDLAKALAAQSAACLACHRVYRSLIPPAEEPVRGRTLEPLF